MQIESTLAQLLRQLAERLTIEPKAKQVIERQNVIGADLLRARLDLWQSVWEQGADTGAGAAASWRLKY